MNTKMFISPLTEEQYGEAAAIIRDGGLLGIPGMMFMPDFPATDYMTAVAIGIVSGLAATGVNQAMKQIGE